MLYKERGPHFIKAFYFNGPSSIPKNSVIVPFQGPASGQTCPYCRQAMGLHGVVTTSNNQLLCPGQYILGTETMITGQMKKDEFEKLYYSIDIEDAIIREN